MRPIGLFSAIASLAVACFAFGCGDSAPEGGGGEGGQSAGGGGNGGGEVASWNGHEVLRVQLALATDDPYGCLGEDPGAPELALVVDVTAADGEASGWIAGTAIGNGEATVRVTSGSTAMSGSVTDPTLDIAPFSMFASMYDSFTLDAFELVAAVGGTVSGGASGTWSIFNGSDAICDVGFTATISGGPDEETPSVWPRRAENRLNLPFEAIPFELTEPVEADGISGDATVGGSSVEADMAPRADPGRDGFASSLEVAPSTIWPAGGSLSLSIGGLVDAAGNEAEVELEPIALAPMPASSPNLSFEDHLVGWLTDPVPPADPGVTGVVFTTPSFTVVDDGGDPFVIDRPQGEAMAVIGINGRLVGHFFVTPDATLVRLQIGFADPDVPDLLANAQGFEIRLVDAAGSTVATATPDSTLFAPPMQTWSGFAELEVPLPTSTDEGLWIVIEPTGFAPPIHLPEVLVDAITPSAS